VASRQRAPTATDHGLVAGGHLLVEDQCAFCLVCPPLRRITKPTGQTFNLQDHRVRAAVRQALMNVAYASSARPRGSAGPIRASRSNANSISPFVGTRSARTNFSLFSVIWFPTTCMYAARADSRKLVLPKADGPELQRAVEATDIQRFHTIGVSRWSRTFPRSPQERPPGTS
jgi:hypothetical protein